MKNQKKFPWNGIKERWILQLLLSLLATTACTDFTEVEPERTANSFYVSPAGSDDNPGTEEQPWQTLAKVYDTEFGPGDRLLLEGGSIFRGTLKIDAADAGSDTARMTIASYGDGRAVIDGADTTALYAEDCDHLVVKNLILRGSGRKAGNTSHGLFLVDCDSIAIDGVEVYGFQHSGIEIHKSVGARLTHVYAHENGFAGIHVSGTTVHDPVNYDNRDLYIGYCIAENNPGDPTVLANHSGNGILASSVDGGLIEYCEAFNNGWDMPWTGNGPVGIWIWDASNFIIQHCVAHHNKTAPGAHDGGGFDFDGGVSNSVLQYNVSYDNEGPGIGLFEFGATKPWENNVVRYNLSVNDGRTTQGGLRIWKAEGKGQMRNCDIYNNTIYSGDPGNYAIGLLTNCPGMRFYNNIFVYDRDFLPEDHKIVAEKFRNNLYWHLNGESQFVGYPSLEDWAKATGQEMREGKIWGKFADPQLDIEHTRLPTSPQHIRREHLVGFYSPVESVVYNGGLDLGKLLNMATGDRDLVGTVLPQHEKYDIGALEIIEDL